MSLSIDPIGDHLVMRGAMSPPKTIMNVVRPRPADLSDLTEGAEYYFELALKMGGRTVNVGTLISVDDIAGEWRAKYYDRRTETSRAFFAPVYKPGTTQKAYRRAGDPLKIPPRITQRDFDYRGRPVFLFAQPLALTPYAQPAADPSGYTRMKDRRAWIRGHVINGEFGGPGAIWNLITIRGTSNAQMASQHEGTIRGGLKRGILYWYGAHVDYLNDSDSTLIRNASDFPRSMAVLYGETEPIPPDFANFKDSPAAMAKTYSFAPPLPADLI
jgi:hypothetical protein